MTTETKPSNSSRDAFEKDYCADNKHTTRRNEVGDYVLPSINDAWCGYEAAIASVPSGEAVAEIGFDPEFLPILKSPMIILHEDIWSIKVGTKLFTYQPDQSARIAELEECLQATREYRDTLEVLVDTSNENIERLKLDNAKLREALTRIAERKLFEYDLSTFAGESNDEF